MARKRIAIMASVVIVLASGRAMAQLSAGDVAFVGYNSDSPDDFAWVALVDIPSNTTVKFTDSSCSNGYFRWSEHLGQITPGPLDWSHTEQIARGTVVRWEGGAGSWSIGNSANKQPAFSASGDQLFAYSGTISENPGIGGQYRGDPATATMLAGINFGNGGWTNASSTSFSAVPSGLSTASHTAVHIDMNDNGYFTGSLTGSVEQIRRAIADPANWTTSDGYINPTAWPTYFEILPDTVLFEFSRNARPDRWRPVAVPYGPAAASDLPVPSRGGHPVVLPRGNCGCRREVPM